MCIPCDPLSLNGNKKKSKFIYGITGNFYGFQLNRRHLCFADCFPCGLKILPLKKNCIRYRNTHLEHGIVYTYYVYIIKLSIKSTEQFPGTAYPSGTPDIRSGF
jgi:hypothetical protein